MGQDYCDKCNNTGLLPFIKEDRVIENAWIDCECKKSEPEYYREVQASDMDFPCSDTFRGYFQEQYGNPHDRMIERDFRQPEESPVVAAAQEPWTQRQQYQLDQTRGELISIRRTLQEITSKKLEIGKAQQPPQKSTYKGLVVKNERD